MRAAINVASGRGVKTPILSASQVSNFLGCKRKWAFISIAKIPTPPGKGATLGTECHTQAENWLQGKPLDFTKPSGEIVQALTPLLPAPMTPMLVTEQAFTFVSFDSGIRYRGIKDWRLIDGQETTVGDHKTTADLRYAKTSEELIRDPQALIYAWDEFQLGAKIVHLQWNYVQTKKPHRTKSVRLTVVQNDVAKNFEALEFSSREMVRNIESRKDPLELEPSPSECEKFGGCPFRHLCNLSPTDRLKAFTSKGTEGEIMGTSDFLASLRARAETPAGLIAGLESAKTEPVVSSDMAFTLVDPEISICGNVATIQINPPERMPEPTAEDRARQEAEAKGKNAVKALEAEQAGEPAKKGRAKKAPEFDGMQDLAAAIRELASVISSKGV